MDQFCGPDCHDLYDRMFEKYEKNLAKVDELYGSKAKNVTPVSET